MKRLRSYSFDLKSVQIPNRKLGGLRSSRTRCFKFKRRGNSCLKMSMIHLLFSLHLLGSALTTPQHPQELVRAYALNPVEINNVYFNPNVVNTQRDIAPQPLIRPGASIEETVHEVEELIRKNPDLPRLTRGEIVDIIENITKNDEALSNSAREEGKRALMVVMPFTAGSARGEDIKELYTRTPVTRIIGAEEHKEKTKNKTKKPPRKWEVNLENEILTNNEIPQFQFLPGIKTSTTTTERVEKKSTKRRRPYGSSYVGQTMLTKPKPKEETTTPKSIPKTTFTPEKIYTNHKYEESAPPHFMPVNDNGYSHPYVIKMKRPHMRPEVTIEKVKITPDMYGDTPKPKPKLEIKITTPQSIPNKLEEVKIPEQTKTSSTTQKNLIFNQIKEKPSANQASAILDDMSIPNQYKSAIKGLDLLITPEDPKVPFTQQILTPVHIPKSSTKTTPLPDISNVANNLSPEMKDLLMSFGLINKPTVKNAEVTTTEDVPIIQNSEINPESYVRFKPLPVNSPGRNDMEELLSRFGLGRSSSRNEKSMDYDKKLKKKTLTKTSEYDFIPDHLKSVVYNLGFNEKNEIITKEKHTFKPDLQHNTTEEELEKLGKLLDMIKDLEHMKGNITEDSLKGFDGETLKELIENFNRNAVVPLDEKDINLNLENFEYNATKKGFKRQEEEQTTTEMPEEVVTVTPSPITSDSPSVTSDDSSLISDKPKVNSLQDLEASFGGMVEIPTTTEEPETTTTPRTGFYYLVDWNTFLELDNQNGKRVNLRFQPHAGNPRYFSSVTVP